MSKIKTCIGCYSYGTSDDMSDCWKCNDYSYYEEQDVFTEIKKQIRADAIDEYTEALRPIVSELKSALVENKNAFIDLDIIAQRLKEQNK